MSQASRILLTGISGVFNGERYLIGGGASVVVGRSRSCDVSASRTKTFRRIGSAVMNRDRAFLKMSRRHFQVFHDLDGGVRVRDLSTNGIRVDGERVQEVVFTSEELKLRRVALSFGGDETFLLSCAGGAEEASRPGVTHESTPSSSGFRG